MSLNLHQIIGGLVLAMVCLAQGAQATNLGVFSDAPYTYFNEKDRKIFHESLDNALNGTKDNELSRWSNPKTGSTGEITPVRQFKRDEHECRELKIFNQSHGRRNQSLQVFCKQPDGSWKWEMVNVK
jgi:surface antigen